MEECPFPRLVWWWPFKHVVFVWGEYALNALRKESLYNVYQPDAPCEVLAFQKSSVPLENELYRGVPVLCFNVKSMTLMLSHEVVERLLMRYSELRLGTVVWLLNPHGDYASCYGLRVHCVREGEGGAEELFGRDRARCERILHETHTLEILFEEDDEFFLEEE